VLVRSLAATPGTLLHRKLTRDDWSLDQHLLAVIADRIAVGNWQRQGKRGAKRPDPISPLAKRRDVERVGEVDGRDPDEVKALLERYRTGVFAAGG